jgi:hypothetical protein
MYLRQSTVNRRFPIWLRKPQKSLLQDTFSTSVQIIFTSANPAYESRILSDDQLILAIGLNHAATFVTRNR